MKKASALTGFDTCGRGLMVLMSLIFPPGWVHRVHSTSTTKDDLTSHIEDPL